MPHTTRAFKTVLVIHRTEAGKEATSYCTIVRAERAIENGVAFWQDKHHTKLVMIRSTPEQLNPNYEFRGRLSIDHSFHPWVPSCDRTGIPTINAGGKTLQLSPKYDRRTAGRHISRPDKLRRRSNKPDTEPIVFERED